MLAVQHEKRRLHALVALHAVVQAGRHAMQTEKRVLNELGRRPFSGVKGEFGLNVTIDCSLGKKMANVTNPALGAAYLPEPESQHCSSLQSVC